MQEVLSVFVEYLRGKWQTKSLPWFSQPSPFVPNLEEFSSFYYGVVVLVFALLFFTSGRQKTLAKLCLIFKETNRTAFVLSVVGRHHYSFFILPTLPKSPNSPGHLFFNILCLLGIKVWILPKFRNKNANFMAKINGHQNFI